MFISTFFAPCSLVSKNSHFIHNSQSKRSSSWPSQSVKWSESKDKSGACVVWLSYFVVAFRYYYAIISQWYFLLFLFVFFFFFRCHLQWFLFSTYLVSVWNVCHSGWHHISPWLCWISIFLFFSLRRVLQLMRFYLRIVFRFVYIAAYVNK